MTDSPSSTFPPPLAIVYVDEHVAVINKPPRFLSVPGKGPANQDCVASRARDLFPDAVGPLIVHRLDMDTSGLLVLGLTPHAQRELSRQFEQRLTSKAYIAVVAGDLSQDEGEVALPIRTDIDNRPHQIVDFTHGKPSITRFTVLSRGPGRTRLRLIPVTGRTHQLRVHCASGLRTPIVGDPLYGDATISPRMLLHAAELGFTHPVTHTSLRFDCPPDF
jgi:tRNA pseudouridine32 synthase/23S rRNA pseudouridine746 synthase